MSRTNVHRPAKQPQNPNHTLQQAAQSPTALAWASASTRSSSSAARWLTSHTATCSRTARASRFSSLLVLMGLRVLGLNTSIDRVWTWSRFPWLGGDGLAWMKWGTTKSGDEINQCKRKSAGTRTCLSSKVSYRRVSFFSRVLMCRHSRDRFCVEYASFLRDHFGRALSILCTDTFDFFPSSRTVLSF